MGGKATEGEEEVDGPLAQLLSRLGLGRGGAERERPQKLLAEFSLKGVTDIIQKIHSSENSESYGTILLCHLCDSRPM